MNAPAAAQPPVYRGQFIPTREGNLNLVFYQRGDRFLSFRASTKDKSRNQHTGTTICFCTLCNASCEIKGDGTFKSDPAANHICNGISSDEKKSKEKENFFMYNLRNGNIVPEDENMIFDYYSNTMGEHLPPLTQKQAARKKRTLWELYDTAVNEVLNDAEVDENLAGEHMNDVVVSRHENDESGGGVEDVGIVDEPVIPAAAENLLLEDNHASAGLSPSIPQPENHRQQLQVSEFDDSMFDDPDDHPLAHLLQAPQQPQEEVAAVVEEQVQYDEPQWRKGSPGSSSDDVSIPPDSDG